MLRDGDLERAHNEHLAWAQARALEYVNRGDLVNAVASMASDLQKHPDWQNSGTGFLVYAGTLAMKSGPEAVRHWIDGFN